MAEKQKRGEAMYQGAIKDKNTIMAQLASKESEIGMYYVLNNLIKSPVLHAWLAVWTYLIFDAMRCTIILLSLPFPALVDGIVLSTLG